jgi:AraC-like DNA-binding protein
MKKANHSAGSIVLVRAEYVLLYIAFLRQLGTPVERELRRARLPTLIEEMPDSFVSMDLAFRFLTHCSMSEGIDDIGFEAGWDVSLDAFSDSMTRALRNAPTPRSRLEVFKRLLTLEDTGVRCELHPEGDMIRICLGQYTPPDGDSRIAEWLNLKAVIEVIRTWMGPDWLLPVVGLESRLSVSNSIRDRLSSVRLLTGQSVPFVMVPSHVLSMPIDGYDAFASAPGIVQATREERNLVSLEDEDLVNRLTMALAPYLASSYPPIDLAAEIAGTSVRNLQRQLSQMRTSYTELIERIRFDQAIRLLRDSDLKILDIALDLGYSDASNFARAFRRISGTSPRELRRQLQAETDSRSVA